MWILANQYGSAGRLKLLVSKYALLVLLVGPLMAQNHKLTPLCLDGLCIGESINDPHFVEVNWIVPNKQFTRESCIHIACKPEVAFRGYPSDTQKQLADALSWVYGSIYFYNV